MHAASAASATPATALAHEIAEQVVEDVREGGRKVALTAAAEAAAGTSAVATHATFEGGVAIAVVGGFLVCVFQDIVGFADFLELDLGVWIVLVAVGVQGLDLAPVGFLDLVRGSPFGDTQHLVVITFCHGTFPFAET